MRGKLRLKKLKFGKSAYIIDYYPPVWNPVKRKYQRRESLKLHVFDHPESTLEVQVNKLNKELAEKIYLKRMKSLVLDANSLFNRDALEADFYEYAKWFIRGKKLADIDTDHYVIAIKYLHKWQGEHVKFRHVDENFLRAFKEFLQTTTSLRSDKIKLAQNSAASYYDKFALIVHQAFLDKYLPEDYTLRVDRINNVINIPELVDDNELQILIENPPEDELVFKSSVFALLTGFRFSAVAIIRWSDFHYSKVLKNWFIEIIDPKPERCFKHYISQDAIDFIGPIQDSNDLVFPGISYNRVRQGLMLWFAKNGLFDKAKFHNWRRKYATNLKEQGTETYVISKMLNHKHESTTQRYIGAIDKAKVDASKKSHFEFIKIPNNGHNQSTSVIRSAETGDTSNAGAD